jgi:predicted double-glycine peptidase
VVWISNTYRQVDLSHYVAFDGAKVSYTLTEHAVTVIGVRPDAVLINDPWFGRAWHPKAQFESAYRTFDGMAVIVGS